MSVTVDALANVHTHLREGDVLLDAVKLALKGGADVLGPMPNTEIGLTTCKSVVEYRAKVWDALPDPCMISYLPIIMINEHTTLRELELCSINQVVNGKMYPLNRTTKSHNGVRNYGKILPLLREAEQFGVKYHFHPEHPNMRFDNRDAEFAFIPIIDMILNETTSTIIWEHGTDARCIPFWKDFAKTGRFFLTLTPHHLLTNEDDVFGDVRAVCKPPIKTRRDAADLIRLIEENNPWVMAGGDDAPHDTSKKHPSEGCCACGAYHAPFLLALYAHALAPLLNTKKGIEVFVNFTSKNARELHKLRMKPRQVKLSCERFLIPNFYRLGSWTVEPFGAGRTIDWQITED